MDQVNTYKLKDGSETTNTYLANQYICKVCSSPEVTYEQATNDAYCAECGCWQNE